MRGDRLKLKQILPHPLWHTCLLGALLIWLLQWERFGFGVSFLPNQDRNYKKPSVSSSRVEFKFFFCVCVCVCRFLFGANGPLVFTDESLLMSLFPSFSTISLTVHDSVGESPSVCETAIFITSHGLNLWETSSVFGCVSLNMLEWNSLATQP